MGHPVDRHFKSLSAAVAPLPGAQRKLRGFYEPKHRDIEAAYGKMETMLVMDERGYSSLSEQLEGFTPLQYEVGRLWLGFGLRLGGQSLLPDPSDI